MTPSIELSPQTFTRLQTHAVPLIDNPESVLNRLLDYYETKGGSASSAVGDNAPAIRQYSPLTPPNLTHAKLLSIELNGKSLGRDQTRWNGLLFAMIREAKAFSPSAAEFKRMVTANFVDGEKTDDGYRFLADVGISVQQQDSNSSWQTACHIAQQLGSVLSVTFVWRQKDGAAYPGVTGQLLVKP